MERSRGVALSVAAFRTVLAVAVFDLCSVLLLMAGALWSSSSADLVIALLLGTGLCVFSLVVVLRGACTRGFLRYFAVLSAVVVLAWAQLVTVELGGARTLAGGLVVLIPVAVVTGAVAQVLLKRTLDNARTSE
ncbi:MULTISPECIES: hypothetical protein [unclassified Actinopolyspora]|uniref:hypothetical protein n=1 Tax=unclassified Actinopolyspora TaxID=2639451 RepID=UPI0013F5C241|nr:MULTISPECIES: hypothetical protein [unclassified Actinopolyspora]NHD16565.1 hypothetical protein [Actinopolyspora sp. BKK2]NHE75572.1 hypothetical protein [Actinopolyspora sp. BKK1]